VTATFFDCRQRVKRKAKMDETTENALNGYAAEVVNAWDRDGRRLIELARRMGVTPGAITRLRRLQSGLGLKSAIGLSKTLGASVEELEREQHDGLEPARIRRIHQRRRPRAHTAQRRRCQLNLSDPRGRQRRIPHMQARRSSHPHDEMALFDAPGGDELHVGRVAAKGHVARQVQQRRRLGMPHERRRRPGLPTTHAAGRRSGGRGRRVV
jgi:plasmid maintenance system antidote protein VapI